MRDKRGSGWPGETSSLVVSPDWTTRSFPAVGKNEKSIIVDALTDISQSGATIATKTSLSFSFQSG